MKQGFVLRGGANGRAVLPLCVVITAAAAASDKKCQSGCHTALLARTAKTTPNWH